VIRKFLERSDREAKLRRWGGKPLEGKGKLNAAEWWKGPNGHPFTIPVEKDSACEFGAIKRLAKDFGKDPPRKMTSVNPVPGVLGVENGYLVKRHRFTSRCWT
jgi:hypothetical protein